MRVRRDPNQKDKILITPTNLRPSIIVHSEGFVTVPDFVWLRPENIPDVVLALTMAHGIMNGNIDVNKVITPP